MHARTSATLALVLSTAALAEPGASLPVREVTAFKDGHALVLRSGRAPVNTDGDVVLDELPRPIMGAFWADENEKNARLASVRAERVPARTTRPVGSVEDVLRANVGRTVTFLDSRNAERTGEILGVTDRAVPDTNQPRPVWDGASWWTPPAPPDTHQRLVMVRTQAGVLTIPPGEIASLRFVGDAPAGELTEDGDGERMVLDLAWDGRPRDMADVSLMYVEKGLRWIPSYRVTILDDDTVRMELQATLVNELADLDDARVHMAVGVPSFAFEHTPDPIALREGLNQLGVFFQRADANMTGGMLSNALLSQTARMGEYRDFGGGSAGANAPAPAPELSGGERAEDLFVFSVDHVSLRKGARMVLPLVSYEAPYHTVYRLDLPAHPPAFALRGFNNDQQRQLAQLLARPVAHHVLRICNENEKRYPITTAPALVVRDGRTLAQGLIPYASPGADLDLEVGSAVDIAVELEETESDRQPKSVRWDNNDYARVDIALDATLTNHKPHAVTIEVRKLAFGVPDSASDDGRGVAVSVFGEEAFWDTPAAPWWQWYSWPYWWHHLNGAARFTWTVELRADEKKTLHAGWHYFWN